MEKFIEQLIAEIKKNKDIECDIRKTIKNNDVELIGLVMSEGQMCKPTIYLDTFYEEYNRGISIESITEHVIRIYEKHKKHDTEFDIQAFTKWENVKDKVIFEVVGMENNRELLEELEYRQWLDMAVIYSVLVKQDKEESFKIKIKREMLKIWGIKETELFKLARENTERLLEYRITNMKSMIIELGKEEGREFNIPELNVGLYVVTNKVKMNGAGVILYKNLIEDFGKSCKKNIYMLPSSRHEMLFIVDNGSCDVEELKTMVHDINMTEVSEEDRLTNSVYYYNREQNRISIC